MYISLFKAEDKTREVNASFNAWEEKKNKKPLISYFWEHRCEPNSHETPRSIDSSV